MFHIITGLVLIAAGVLGVFDGPDYVATVLKGGLPLCLMLFGLIAMLAGFIPPRTDEEYDNEQG